MRLRVLLHIPKRVGARPLLLQEDKYIITGTIMQVLIISRRPLTDA